MCVDPNTRKTEERSDLQSSNNPSAAAAAAIRVFFSVTSQECQLFSSVFSSSDCSAIFAAYRGRQCTYVYIVTAS